MFDNDSLRTACAGLADDMTRFLDQLVRFDSVSGNEGPAMHWLHGQFAGLVDTCELVPVPETLRQDDYYQFVIDEPFEGRPNLRLMLKGDGTGRSMIFNAHVDVVPPSEGQDRAFDPYVEDGRLFGRGAADDKGQIAVIYTFLKAMKQLGLRPRGDMIVHIVIEEETGGNGTLAMARSADRADCCVVLDGAEGNVFSSIRGALWFTAVIKGRAAHSAQPGSAVSAIDMACEVMRIIREYRDELLEQTRHDDPLFAGHPNPMPVTFGQLNAGTWPAMTPAEAVLKGVFGILTTPRKEAERGIERAVRERGPSWLAEEENFRIEFPYSHDMMRTDPQAPMATLMRDSWRAQGIESEISPCPASCDAWFYERLTGMPTVMTGITSWVEPHTAHEHAVLADLALEAAVMLGFIRDWSGFAPRG